MILTVSSFAFCFVKKRLAHIQGRSVPKTSLKTHILWYMESLVDLLIRDSFIISQNWRGLKWGITCIQHNFFCWDKDQYFIINYLIPSWDHFIAPAGKS